MFRWIGVVDVRVVFVVWREFFSLLLLSVRGIFLLLLSNGCSDSYKVLVVPLEVHVGF
jgi:hypothetical protein